MESRICRKRTHPSRSKVQWGIFQENSPLPQLFIITNMTHNYIVKIYTGGYKFTKSQEKINHFIYLDYKNKNLQKPAYKL